MYISFESTFLIMLVGYFYFLNILLRVWKTKILSR